MEDSGIVELYWKRDQQAITETASKYGRYCHGIAYNILGSHEDAEESVNDTYKGAWDSIPPNRPAILSAYLGKLTRRISLKTLRSWNAQKRGSGRQKSWRRSWMTSSKSCPTTSGGSSSAGTGTSCPSPKSVSSLDSVRARWSPCCTAPERNF